MSRLKICEHCGIYDPTRRLCNGSLYINPDTNDVSTSPKSTLDSVMDGLSYIFGLSIYEELVVCTKFNGIYVSYPTFSDKGIIVLLPSLFRLSIGVKRNL